MILTTTAVVVAGDVVAVDCDEHDDFVMGRMNPIDGSIFDWRSRMFLWESVRMWKYSVDVDTT